MLLQPVDLAMRVIVYGQCVSLRVAHIKSGDATFRLAHPLATRIIFIGYRHRRRNTGYAFEFPVNIPGVTGLQAGGGVYFVSDIANSIIGVINIPCF